LLATLLILSGCASDGGGESGQGKADDGAQSATAAADERVFEYASGGASHFEGHGEWRVRVTAGGAMTVAHDVRGTVTDHGTVFLTRDETADLWQAIDAAGVDQLASSTAPGIPDDVKQTFALRAEGKERAAAIWGNEVRKNTPLVALKQQLARLVEAYTGAKPVL
jgi:hypothetical protein